MSHAEDRAPRARRFTLGPPGKDLAKQGVHSSNHQLSSKLDRFHRDHCAQLEEPRALWVEQESTSLFFVSSRLACHIPCIERGSFVCLHEALSDEPDYLYLQKTEERASADPSAL